MRRIQNNQKSIGKPIQPKDFKNDKTKKLPNVCNFQKKRTLGYGFKNL
jgi:hypothetical protein